jgi:hypothetical protein
MRRSKLALTAASSTVPSWKVRMDGTSMVQASNVSLGVMAEAR